MSSFFGRKSFGRSVAHDEFLPKQARIWAAVIGIHKRTLPQSTNFLAKSRVMFVVNMILALIIVGIVAAAAARQFSGDGKAISVNFDGRSYKVDGERVLFIAGSVHYPRAPRSEWASILQKTKESGVNLVQTYVFWDIHEPQNDQWNFPSDPTSSEDLVAFVQEAAKAGLYVHLRIAGYVCAEWNFGGMPVWLRDLNVTLRTYEDVWLQQLSQFMEKTLSVVRDANLLAAQGGPIIMLQIENEYGNMEDNYGARGHKYVQWLSDYAQSLDSGGAVWVMCQQGEGVGTAPAASIVNACNGFYCDNWIEQHTKDFPSQPHMWTENWPGWFQNWGEPVPHRPAVDVAFAVARWFARGGAYMNYYMLYGGTTFGRQVGGPLIVTSYDYDVQLNEYSMTAEPKYSLLQQLHGVLLSHASTILGQSVPAAEVQSQDNHCEVHRYTSDNDCIAFLSNWGESDTCVFPLSDGSSTAEVSPWSVSIASGTNCSTVVYNTRSTAQSIPATSKHFTAHAEVQFVDVSGTAEPIPSVEGSSAPHVDAGSPLEQLSLTRDDTDYLWYSTSFTSTITTGTAGSMMSAKMWFDSGAAGGAVYHVYVDGVRVASTYGTAGGNPINTEAQKYPDSQKTQKDYNPPVKVSLDFSLPVYDAEHVYKVDILSVSMGLKNYGPYLETISVGIVSSAVHLSLHSQTTQTLALQQFTHHIGLQGEKASSSSAIRPSAALQMEQRGCDAYDRSRSGLCWFSARFRSPVVDASDSASAQAFALNLGSALGKGQVWVNGHMLGRYWNVTATATAAQNHCDDSRCGSGVYVGAYSGDRCRSGCGEPSQLMYKLPRDWLVDGEEQWNELKVFEELGADFGALQLFSVSMV